MTYKEISAALAALTEASYELERMYVENEGEVTDETAAQEELVAQIRGLLNSEGVDSLGEWLKSLEDKKAELKAQKDYIQRRIASTENTIDFVKQTVSAVLDAVGEQKVKGDRGYSFARAASMKTTVFAAKLDEDFLDLVTEAARNAGLPGYIDVALKTTSTKINDWAHDHDGEGAGYVNTEITPTVRFQKPRASK